MNMAMNPVYGHDLQHENIGDKNESSMNDEIGSHSKIRDLRLYVYRILENRPERVSISLLNVVKVCKIVEKQKMSNDLFRGVRFLGYQNF